MNFTKSIDIEDFSSPDLEPYLQYLADMEMARFGSKQSLIVPDSKHWECAMAMNSFEKNCGIKAGQTYAGIGAGVEATTFFLAAKGAVVFPCDRYLEDTPWSNVAPAGMMIDSSIYTNLPHYSGNVIPVHTDARRLKLPTSFFDGVYSSGSIEHFGSLDAVVSTMVEIGRILKPGGLASISTEFKLDGPADKPWFDDNCILFTPQLIHEYIVQSSGLELIGHLPIKPSEATFESRVELLDFLNKVSSINSIEEKLMAYPNLVIQHDGFLFCSVHLLLRKPIDWLPPKHSFELVSRFGFEIDATGRKAIDKLNKKIRGLGFVTSDSKESDKGKQGLLVSFLQHIKFFVVSNSRLKMSIMRIMNKTKITRRILSMLKDKAS